MHSRNASDEECIEAYTRAVFAVAMRNGGTLLIKGDEIPEESTVNIAFRFLKNGDLEIRAERVTN